MLQIVFCSVIYQNNGHNMTYRWVSCHQVYDVFIKTNFNISNKANTFWECIFTSQSHANQVTQTLLDESMSEWVNRFKPDKKFLPQGSAAVSCCSWFSAFILGALQGALMFCLLIHFEKLLFARCDWILNTCRLCTTSFAGLLSKHSRMSPRLGTLRWYWILSICCKNQTKILCQRYPVQPHLITAKFWEKNW